MADGLFLCELIYPSFNHITFFTFQLALLPFPGSDGRGSLITGIGLWSCGALVASNYDCQQNPA